jgi:uncharacterized protein (DUF1778 family)
MATATDRLEVRVAPAKKARIAHAAKLLNVSVSEFALAAAEKEADAVLAEHSATTVVPDDFFEEMLVALDEPTAANARLLNAMARARETVIHD